MHTIVVTAHVSIHNGMVTPKSQHVQLGGDVEFKSDRDCTVVFYDGTGMALHLKAGVPGMLRMTSNGEHHFHVVYDTAVYAEHASLIHEEVTGCTTVMQLSISVKAAAVPTGDILVP